MIKRIYEYCRYDIPRGIKNLVIWFPTVWRDRQWDHQFIYQVFRHKLHLQEQFIRHYGIHVNNVKDADRIKRCVDILDRLIDDVYHEEAFAEHYKNWGHPDIGWKKVDKDIDEYLKDDEFVQMTINYPKVETQLDKEKEKIDFRKACNKETRLRESDIKELFDIMEKHIQEWWD